MLIVGAIGILTIPLPGAILVAITIVGLIMTIKDARVAYYQHSAIQQISIEQSGRLWLYMMDNEAIRQFDDPSTENSVKAADVYVVGLLAFFYCKGLFRRRWTVCHCVHLTESDRVRLRLFITDPVFEGQFHPRPMRAQSLDAAAA